MLLHAVRETGTTTPYLSDALVSNQVIPLIPKSYQAYIHVMSLSILVPLVDTPVKQTGFSHVKLHVRAVLHLRWEAVFEEEALSPVQKKSLFMNPTGLELQHHKYD